MGYWVTQISLYLLSLKINPTQSLFLLDPTHYLIFRLFVWDLPVSMLPADIRPHLTIIVHESYIF